MTEDEQRRILREWIVQYRCPDSTVVEKMVADVLGWITGKPFQGLDRIAADVSRAVEILQVFGGRVAIMQEQAKPPSQNWERFTQEKICRNSPEV